MKQAPKPKPVPRTSQEIVADILARLPFDEKTLPLTIRDQAKLYVDTARYRVLCLRRMNIAEIELKKVRATASTRLRDKYANAGRKLTEGALKNIMDLDETVLRAEAALDRAEELKEWAYHLLEAVGGRRDSQRAYVALITGNAPMTVQGDRR